MSQKPPVVKSLSTLVNLREQEVERLTTDVAAKQAVRERYRRSLARMEQLCRDSGASSDAGGDTVPGALTPMLSPALSLNCAAYKQSVMQMADAHRADLALHEADMAVAQRALHAAVNKREVLDTVLQRQLGTLQRQQAAREQKREDDLAAQVWMRGQR